ncbi:MAG: Sua5/YciO/YrdC/YwlC family protein [Oligoflexia bacterium]|nr:Sua5/YciO/YrdC/YwlC family protein [Oligoflexia bacterium]
MKKEILAYPTDTVWGIGCDIYNEEAVAMVHQIKKSDPTKPLSTLIPNVEFLSNILNEDLEYLNKDWLKKFFSLETTILLPIKSLNVEIPKWVLADSEYASFRCLRNEAIDEIFKQNSNPIISTSLNLTGTPPIIDLEEAEVFFQKYIGEKGRFYPSDAKKLSGHSSTIIKCDPEGYSIVREGMRVSEVKEFLGLSTT